MAEETMRDFEKELEESYKNMDTTEDPEAGKWEVFEKMIAEKTVSKVKITEVVKGGFSKIRYAQKSKSGVVYNNLDIFEIGRAHV